MLGMSAPEQPALSAWERGLYLRMLAQQQPRALEHATRAEEARLLMEGPALPRGSLSSAALTSADGPGGSSGVGDAWSLLREGGMLGCSSLSGALAGSALTGSRPEQSQRAHGAGARGDARSLLLGQPVDASAAAVAAGPGGASRLATGLQSAAAGDALHALRAGGMSDGALLRALLSGSEDQLSSIITAQPLASRVDAMTGLSFGDTTSSLGAAPGTDTAGMAAMALDHLAQRSFPSSTLPRAALQEASFQGSTWDQLGVGLSGQLASAASWPGGVTAPGSLGQVNLGSALQGEGAQGRSEAQEPRDGSLGPGGWLGFGQGGARGMPLMEGPGVLPASAASASLRLAKGVLAMKAMAGDGASPSRAPGLGLPQGLASTPPASVGQGLRPGAPGEGSQGPTRSLGNKGPRRGGGQKGSGPKASFSGGGQTLSSSRMHTQPRGMEEGRGGERGQRSSSGAEGTEGTMGVDGALPSPSTVQESGRWMNGSSDEKRAASGVEGSVSRRSEPHTEEEKRLRKLALNREAARRMRRRQATRLEQLEKTVLELQAANLATRNRLKDAERKVADLESRNSGLEDRVVGVVGAVMSQDPPPEALRKKVAALVCCLGSKALALLPDSVKTMDLQSGGERLDAGSDGSVEEAGIGGSGEEGGAGVGIKRKMSPVGNLEMELESQGELGGEEDDGLLVDEDGLLDDPLLLVGSGREDQAMNAAGDWSKAQAVEHKPLSGSC